ncbi:MAG TPA: CFI-box-CTERM domain-containing protein [Polyangia bacterium]|nr:CFI-box-CTERM domain-containing protein [Polyangia bacterium]
MTLAVLQSDGKLHEVPLATGGSVLDRAECTCDDPDRPQLYAEIKLTSFLGPEIQSLAVWVGRECNVTANRTSTSTLCREVSQRDISHTDFQTGGRGSSAPLFQRIPAQALLLPGGEACPTGDTDGASATNSIWFIFTTSGSSSDNYCMLQLPSRTQLPDVPAYATTDPALGGDGAVTIRWQNPTATSTQPQRYQVLCATADGQPVPGKSSSRQYYSVCTSEGLRRQYIDNATTTYPAPTGSVVDGGTGSDAGAADGGTDGGTDGATGGGTDASGGGGGSDAGTGGGSCSGVVTPSGLMQLDPRYLCTNSIDATARQARVTGLTNNETYQFVLVGIDNNGNARAASGVVCARAQQVEDFYTHFRNEGGKAQGFCFIATAAYGSYESPYVQVLRRFRDEVLLPSERGRAFVDWYYRNSPGPAKYIADPAHGTLRWLVRMALWPVIAMAWLWLALGPLGLVLLAAACAAWPMRRRLWHALALGVEAQAQEQAS